eukprot:14601223-Alexandrium_andersonii.AAC.1
MDMTAIPVHALTTSSVLMSQFYASGEPGVLRNVGSGGQDRARACVAARRAAPADQLLGRCPSAWGRSGRPVGVVRLALGVEPTPAML